MSADDARELGALSAKLDALTAAFEDHRAELRQWQRDLDGRLFGHDGLLTRYSARLRALERWRAWIAGALAVLSVVAAWLSSWWPGGHR